MKKTEQELLGLLKDRDKLDKAMASVGLGVNKAGRSYWRRCIEYVLGLNERQD